MLRRFLLLAACCSCSSPAVGSPSPAARRRCRREGPTSVAGTEASAGFQVGDRTIRQVRYVDRRHAALRVPGRQRRPAAGARRWARRRAAPHPAVHDHRRSAPARSAEGEAEEFTLSLHMAGCETLSSRAGSFVTRVAVRTETAGMFDDTVELDLPEEIHTGSPARGVLPQLHRDLPAAGIGNSGLSSHRVSTHRSRPRKLARAARSTTISGPRPRSSVGSAKRPRSGARWGRRRHRCARGRRTPRCPRCRRRCG